MVKYLMFLDVPHLIPGRPNRLPKQQCRASAALAPEGFKTTQAPVLSDVTAGEDFHSMSVCSGTEPPALQGSRGLLFFCGLAAGAATLEELVGADAAEVAPVHGEQHHGGGEGLVAEVGELFGSWHLTAWLGAATPSRSAAASLATTV